MRSLLYTMNGRALITVSEYEADLSKDYILFNAEESNLASLQRGQVDSYSKIHNAQLRLAFLMLATLTSCI